MQRPSETALGLPGDLPYRLQKRLSGKDVVGFAVPLSPHDSLRIDEEERALGKHAAGVQDPVTAGRLQVRKITQERVRQLE